MSEVKNLAIEYFNDANKMYNGKLYDDALKLYKKAVDTDLTFGNAHYCVSKTLLRLRRVDEGISYFNKYQHLLPENNRFDYVKALSDILLEEKNPKESLKLIEQYEDIYIKNKPKDYLKLLIQNGKIHSIDEVLIKKFSDEKKINSLYQGLIQDETIGKTDVEKLKNGSAIPQYVKYLEQIRILLNAEISNDSYNAQITEVKNQFSLIRENPRDSFKIFSLINGNLDNIKKLLFEQVQRMNKAGYYEKASRNIEILKKCQYDNDLLQQVDIENKKLYSQYKSKKNRKILITIVAILSTLIIIIASVYFIKKKGSYKKTLQSTSLSDYDNYLNKYGDNDKIHALRENKLYEIAVNSNNSVDINRLASNYPQSSFLKKVDISIIGNTESFEVFGADSPHDKLIRNKKNTYLVPQGCKIGYKASFYKSIPIERYLTIVENISISDTMKSAKKKLFNESFHNNKNNWKTFHEEKKVWGGYDKKGMSVNDGGYHIYNEYNENVYIHDVKKIPSLNKSIDFDIEAIIQRDDLDTGTFVEFGATSRGFNFFGINRSSIIYGYNHWDREGEKWVNQSNGWENNNTVNSAPFGQNHIKIEKRSNNISFYVNDIWVGEMVLKKWYGNAVGFGINNKTKAKILEFNVLKVKSRDNTLFRENKIYFPWVEELNVRNGSKRGSEILTTVKKGEPLKYLGEKGNDFVRTSFKNIYSPDYYYKVELIDGTQGWVHGGAIKSVPTLNPISFDIYKK